MTETQMGLLRFENWKRWACGGECAMILQLYYPSKAAVAGQHVSSEVWDDDDVPMPVDVRDAELVERMLRHLPIHLCKAVRYKYTGRPKHIGIPESVLTQWVEQAAREIMVKKFHVIA